MYFMGSGLFESFFSVIFMVMFVGIFVVFIASFTKGVSQWNKNNHSPKLTVPAKVVAKRDHRTHHHSSGANGMSHTHTTYYVTFEVESGDRMELVVDGSEYGMLVEGDYGMLSFQGTRYLSFERRL